MMCSNFQGVRQCLAHNFGQQCNSSHAVECAERLISTHGLFPALRSINWKCLSFIPCLSWKLALSLSLLNNNPCRLHYVCSRAPCLYPKSTMRCQEAWFPNVIPEQTERRAQNGARARQCFSRCMQKVTFSRERAHTPENENACWNAAAWHKLICKLLNRPHTYTPTSNFLGPSIDFPLFSFSLARTHLTLSPFSSLCCCRRRFSLAPACAFPSAHIHTLKAVLAAFCSQDASECALILSHNWWRAMFLGETTSFQEQTCACCRVHFLFIFFHSCKPSLASFASSLYLKYLKFMFFTVDVARRKLFLTMSEISANSVTFVLVCIHWPFVLKNRYFPVRYQFQFQKLYILLGAEYLRYSIKTSHEQKHHIIKNTTSQIWKKIIHACHKAHIFEAKTSFFGN